MYVTVNSKEIANNKIIIVIHVWIIKANGWFKTNDSPGSHRLIAVHDVTYLVLSYYLYFKKNIKINVNHNIHVQYTWLIILFVYCFAV